MIKILMTIFTIIFTLYTEIHLIYLLKLSICQASIVRALMGKLTLNKSSAKIQPTAHISTPVP